TIKFPPNYLPDIESQYHMDKKIGSGAFGTVYKAYYKEGDKEGEKDGKVVALKLLDPKRINRAELEQEVGLLTEISKGACHKNVVCYYGFFPSRFLGKPVMVVSMEFIDGNDIWDTLGPGNTVTWKAPVLYQTPKIRGKVQDKIKLTDKPLQADLARHITDRLLQGLKFLHDMGIYHLDIKEGNVMVMKDGLEPVYVDFGLACKARIPIGPYSCDKANGGSPYYMSKRRLICASSGSDPCSEEDNRQADIWALGMLLLKVLSRQELPDDADPSLKFPAIQNWLKKNSNNLYIHDKSINNVIKTALSDDPTVTVDDLISIFNGSPSPTGYSDRALPTLPEIPDLPGLPDLPDSTETDNELLDKTVLPLPVPQPIKIRHRLKIN
ncbi:MAG: protein kinase, partial [Candidatus Paceibacterota bacterium]